MNVMSQSASTLLIVLVVVLTAPLWIGLAGGLFGLMVGLFGMIFGLLGGLFGLVTGLIGGIFGGIGSLFSWFWGIGSFEVFLLLILIVSVIAIRKPKRTSR